jgi:hypothetical protein
MFPNTDNNFAVSFLAIETKTMLSLFVQKQRNSEQRADVSKNTSNLQLGIFLTLWWSRFMAVARPSIRHDHVQSSQLAQ